MYGIETMGFFKKRQFIKHIKNFADYINLNTELNREIYISTITPEIAEKIDKTIRMWNYLDEVENIELAKRIPIKIYINSLGGDFSSSLTIVDAIKLSRTPIYTFNIGIVQKEAFLIYLIGQRRYSYPNATFLYLRDLKNLENNSPETQNDKYINFYQRQLNNLKDLIIERTKITENEYNKHLKNMWWITAEDAYKLRICTDILHTINLK